MLLEFDPRRIRSMMSARNQLKNACKQVGGRLTIDYETGEVICKLPNDKEIVAIDDITVEVYDPELGTEEINGLIKILPGEDRILIRNNEGEEIDLEL